MEAQSLDSNYFNNNLRYKFARYPLLRGLLGLHFDGDAKADYLGSHYNSITIRVISMKELSVDGAILENLSEKIQKATRKPTKYVLWNIDMPFNTSSNIGDLKAYPERETFSGSSKEANLYLLVANELKGQSDQIGSTVQENSIVLFEGSLLKYEHSNEEIFNRFVIGVLLHEFGHQIGLTHNDYPRCLMNPSVEFSSSNRLSEVVDGFCEDEKEEMSRITF